jgi:hypothetical protein
LKHVEPSINFWNNKFYYKVASCWLFLLIGTTMHGYMNVKFINLNLYPYYNLEPQVSHTS